MYEHRWYKVGRFWRWEFYRCQKCGSYSSIRRGTYAEALLVEDCPLS